MRHTRPLIALAAAYSMMLAAVFGAASFGQSAALGAPAFCRAFDPAGDQAPAAPARHDLDCCIACSGSASALPAPALGTGISIPALTGIIWQADIAVFFHSPINGSPSARAPPAGI